MKKIPDKEQIQEQLHEYNVNIIGVYDLAKKLDVDVDELKSILVSYNMHIDTFMEDLTGSEYEQIVSDVANEIIELIN